MNRFFLTLSALVILPAYPLHVGAQNTAIKETLEEIRMMETALLDLREDLKVARGHLDDGGRPSMGRMTVHILDEQIPCTIARLNNFEDVVRLRHLMVGSRDEDKLEAADAWINLRANMILFDIDRGIMVTSWVQEFADNQRIEAIAVDLRKHSRRIRQLWQEKKQRTSSPVPAADALTRGEQFDFWILTESAYRRLVRLVGVEKGDAAQLS